MGSQAGREAEHGQGSQAGHEAEHRQGARLGYEPDPEVLGLLDAIKHDGSERASTSLKRRLLEAIKHDGSAFERASTSLKRRLIDATKHDASVFEYASASLKSSSNFVLQAVRENPEAFNYASMELRGNREFLLEAMKESHKVFKYASMGLRGNREFLLEAMKESHKVFKYASMELRGNREFLLEAVKENPEAFRYASKELRGDREFLLRAFKTNRLDFASSELQKDRKLMMKVMGRNVDILEDSSTQFLDNPDFMLQAMQVPTDARLLKYTSERLRGNRDFMLQALRADWTSAIGYMNKRLWEDRAFALEAVGTNGDALRLTSESLRGDHAVVMKAVRNNGASLKYAFIGLRGDRDVVTEAVHNFPNSVQFATEDLRGDRDCIVEACSFDEGCINHAPEQLQADKDQIIRDARVVRQRREELRDESDAFDAECSFYFLDAALVKSLADTFPAFKDLRAKGWLTERRINFSETVRGEYKHDFLAVSHCWEEPIYPDMLGHQLEKVKEYLAANPRIRWVWYGFCCMPKGQRSPLDDIAVKRMLPRVNSLYLGCMVLMLIDRTYLSRFWTQFEGWLALQTCSDRGIVGSVDSERYHMEFLHNATQQDGTTLLSQWKNASSDEAYRVLSKPDIRVTNQKDKQAQLPKILSLNEAVKKAFETSSQRGRVGSLSMSDDRATKRKS